MKLKTAVLLSTVAIALSGCQLLTSSVDIAASTIFASDKIDAMQTELGEFSTNQDALIELDKLQAEIKHTLTTGDNAPYVESYQARSLIIYATLKSEAESRWDELTANQQVTLTSLDAELIDLNDAVNSLKESSTFDNDVISLLYRATILMTYYKGF
jgi:hypothetical protein